MWCCDIYVLACGLPGLPSSGILFEDIGFLGQSIEVVESILFFLKGSVEKEFQR